MDLVLHLHYTFALLIPRLGHGIFHQGQSLWILEPAFSPRLEQVSGTNMAGLWHKMAQLAAPDMRWFWLILGKFWDVSVGHMSWGFILRIFGATIPKLQCPEKSVFLNSKGDWPKLLDFYIFSILNKESSFSGLQGEVVRKNFPDQVLKRLETQISHIGWMCIGIVLKWNVSHGITKF